MPTVITTYCHIKENKVFRDGKLLFKDNDDASLKSFLKKVYSELHLKYPKFYKMDEISKLGFLAAEVLLQNVSVDNIDSSLVGITLSNSQSTLVTDIAHQQTIQNENNYFPSPSIFVYTLPNIMIGEISIRHKFRGENAFFIFEHFNAEFVSDYINLLFKNQKIKACIGGWVDQSENQYEAFMYWAELSENVENSVQHDGNQVKQCYEII